jgi:hypothetical protein
VGKTVVVTMCLVVLERGCAMGNVNAMVGYRAVDVRNVEDGNVI